MQNETLIKMANQVGDFFGADPHSAQANIEIANHLNRFWTLDMRQQIAKYVAEQSGIGLHQQVIVAISDHLKV